MFHYMIFEHISHDSIVSYVKETVLCYDYLNMVILFVYHVNVSIHFLPDCKNINQFRKRFQNSVSLHDTFEHMTRMTTLSYVRTFVL